MKHELPPLPYPKNALEPVMSAETLEYHHGKHHKAYVDKLNTLIPGTEFESKTLEEIMLTSSGPIFNNAGQVWNHTFFWNCLTPKSRRPEGALLASIEKDFGSFDQFTEKFIALGTNTFGSGWVWLVHDQSSGKLTLESTSNAQNPLVTGKGKTPLLTSDVWEHAYYIDYRNERPRYLKSIFGILNWEFAEKNYLACKKN